ncbi:unnamed protein product, partial [Phaeothamnion confervicola]
MRAALAVAAVTASLAFHVAHAASDGASVGSDVPPRPGARRSSRKTENDTALSAVAPLNEQELMAGWDAYKIVDDADAQASWRLIEAATLNHRTFVYDKLGRWQLSVAPGVLEELMPMAVTRVTIPVSLANGSMHHIHNFPSVDFSHLFMHAMVAAQELGRRINDGVAIADAAEAGAAYASKQLTAVAASQNETWETAAQLRAVRLAADIEVRTLRDATRRLRDGARYAEESLRLRHAAADDATATALRMDADANAAADALDAAARIEELRLRIERAERQEAARLAAGRASLAAEAANVRTRLAAAADRTAAANVAAVMEAAEVARLNEDLELRRIRARGAEERQKVREVVSAAFLVLAAAVRTLYADPALLGRLTLALLALAAGAFTAKHSAAVARSMLERRFARPVLVRETSRPSHALAAAAVWLLPSSRKRLFRNLPGAAAAAKAAAETAATNNAAASATRASRGAAAGAASAPPRNNPA